MVEHLTDDGGNNFIRETVLQDNGWIRVMDYYEDGTVCESYEKPKPRFYAYLRVSTTKQDVARQYEAINNWKKKNNIDIPEENYFIDYYTGTTFDRQNYQELKDNLREGDYIVVKEVDRLGRNWTGIKDEWNALKDGGINIVIIDMPILSDKLPNEENEIDSLDNRLIKEQILTLLCYVAQKEREKISNRTKEALAEKKLHGTKSGKPIGRPTSERSNQKNHIEVLKYIIENNVGQDKACYKCNVPTSSFRKQLQEWYSKYNTKDYRDILYYIEK